MKALLLGSGREGRGSYPAYIQDIDGKMLLERAMESVSSCADGIIVTFLKENVERFHLDGLVRQIDPRAEVLSLSHETAGAACSALLAIDRLDLSEELLLVNLTDLAMVDLNVAISEFRGVGADAGTLVFPSLRPMYSFARTEAGGRVVEIAEKRPISRWATAGVYWFRTAQLFVDSAEIMILKRASIDHRYYVAPALNEVILTGGHVHAFEIDAMDYVERKSI